VGKPAAKEVYDKLLDAFRKHNDHPVLVAKIAGCNYRTAQRCWELGYPARGLDPIRVVLAREQEQARALIMEQQASRKRALAEERELSSKQAAQVRAQEGQLVALGRSAAVQAMAVGVTLVQSARGLAERVKTEIEQELKVPGLLDRGVALRLLKDIVYLQNQINSMAAASMTMERIHLGQPTSTVAITSTTEMTMEEAAARIEMANHALETARRVGGLKVLDGGLVEPKIGKPVVVRRVVAEEETADGVARTYAKPGTR
jgi:hypothetical protein